MIKKDLTALTTHGLGVLYTFCLKKNWILSGEVCRKVLAKGSYNTCEKEELNLIRESYFQKIIRK